jgi:hypothetical protein
MNKIKMLSQSIKRFSNQGNSWHRSGKVLKFIICIIAGVIATIGVSMYLSTGVAPSANTYTTSWIGNTFGGGDKWIQIQVSSIYVASDGTVFTNSPWDEAGREVGIYKNGDVIGKADDLHGWGRLGGVAVTADKKYIYVAMQQSQSGNPGEDYPPSGTNWHCVRRYDLSGKPAPFSGGRGWDKSMLIVSKKSQVTGLAILGNHLYVSDPADNRVRIYNTDTMQELQNFPVPNPGQITVDRQGNLWIIQNKKDKTPAKILHYSKQGQQLPGIIKEVVEPTAIAVNNQGRLLVADNGPRQQVLIYQLTKTPVLVGTFGTKGGVVAGIPGEVQDDKFVGLSGLGTDAAGNIYIANDGFNRSGVDLRKFSPNGTLQWRLLGLQFIDNADTDPITDGVDVYTKHEHFVMDYKKPVGEQWIYKGYTLNPFKYPQDPRLHTAPDAPWFRRIKSKPFLFLTNMYADQLQIYRFQKSTDGEIAIPSGMFVISTPEGKPLFSGNWPPHQPSSGEWIWRDSNGNVTFESDEYDSSKDLPYLGGWWVDSSGDVWKTLRTQDGVGIRHYPVQGLDAKGNPIYTYKSMEKQKTPSMFTDLRRIEYYPATDTMYLSGFTKEHPEINDDTGVVGSEIIRFDNWSRGNRTPRWRTVIPYDTTGKREVATAAMSVAGDYVFVVTVKNPVIYVYKTATGAQVQKLKPGPEVSGESGWVDIPYGIRAVRRSNGEYLLFTEDDQKGKVIMYQLKS